ncbi:MAG: alpha-beta hydrolase superfamily lysophospholipase, partial [Lentimonas sp.]
MNITQQITSLLIAGIASTSFALASTETAAATQNDVLYKTVEIDGVDIFYREAGSPDAPTLLLLHGFPTSSHMFRELIEDLKGDYHLVAP